MLAFAPAALALLWGSVLLAFARPLVARWREPVLRQPALVIESDDWGAGPLEQAAALRGLAALLRRVHDGSGRRALMTLGVVLEVPDGPRIAASGGSEYHARTLADARFAAVREAIQAGIADGVFVPQLHGQCHYWPPALLAAARIDDAVRAWLTAAEPAPTEALPAALQARWVDAARLPAAALPPADVDRAVAEECANYASIFGAPPKVAVATTFVWNETVEAAWARCGVAVIVSPGVRATGRDARGQPAGVDRTMLSGQRAPSGLIYLVRDVYFEPVRGHAPQQLVAGLRARTRQGRACLVETHRCNFLQARDASLAALEAGLAAALAAFPGLCFVSPLELARAMRERDPAWIETRWRPRLAAWRARLDEIPRFRRAARLSGLHFALALLRGES
ncbi:MAG: hypothetical protein ACYC5S_06115 [Thiobacillus sp.]